MEKSEKQEIPVTATFQSRIVVLIKIKIVPLFISVSSSPIYLAYLKCTKNICIRRITDLIFHLIIFAQVCIAQNTLRREEYWQVRTAEVSTFYLASKVERIAVFLRLALIFSSV